MYIMIKHMTWCTKALSISPLVYTTDIVVIRMPDFIPCITLPLHGSPVIIVHIPGASRSPSTHH